MRRSRLLRSVLYCSLVVAMMSTAPPASGGHFTKLVVFGDSLSDTGNIFTVTAGQAPASPPNYLGRFSNGPVWVEYLATALDLPMENFAYGGAQTGHGNLFEAVFPDDFPGLIDEVAFFLDQPAAVDPDALYVVWAGANDFRAALLQGLLPDVGAMIDNLLNVIETLSAAGARYVLVPNLPDLGLTPEGRGLAGGGPATYASAAFNTLLERALVTYAPNAIRLDVFHLTQQVVNDPSEFGFSNVTTPCLTTVVCATPETYVFWDRVHPTTHGHAVLADKAAKAINQAVRRDLRQP